MLDDDAGGGPSGVKFGNAFIRRVGVVDVVVGEFLALQLPRRGDAEALTRRAIEGRALVRVLAVAQRLDELAAESAVVGRIVIQRIGKPVGDRRIVGGGARIGLGRKFLPQLQRCHAGVLCHLAEHQLIVRRLDYDGDIGVVLGGGADHRRPADVDILDAVVERGAFGDSCLERVEIDDEQVDRADVVLLHRRDVILVGADRQQTAVHLRVQRFHPAVHHLRKAGQVGDIDYLQPGILERLRGAAGGDELDIVAGKRRGEVDEPGLVGHRQQCAGNTARVAAHGLPASTSSGRKCMASFSIHRTWRVPGAAQHHLVTRCRAGTFANSDYGMAADLRRVGGTIHSGNSGSSGASLRGPMPAGVVCRKHQRTCRCLRALP